MFFQLLDLLWDGMQRAVGFFRGIEIISGVSVWTVICCSFVLAVADVKDVWKLIAQLRV